MTEYPSIDQAVSEHLNGNVEIAVQAYRQILDDDPIHPKALHYYGIYLHQIGHNKEAIEKLQLASAL